VRSQGRSPGRDGGGGGECAEAAAGGEGVELAGGAAAMAGAARGGAGAGGEEPGRVHSDGHPRVVKKSASSISERERLRKAGDLVEPQINSFDLQPPVAHRAKNTVTFSERQRRRKRAGNGFNGFSLTENECYDSLDQLFPGARADYASFEYTASRRAPQSLFDSWNLGIRRFLEERTGGNSSLQLNGPGRNGAMDAEFENDVGEALAGRLRTANAVPEFPMPYHHGPESDKEDFEENGVEDGVVLPEEQKASKFRFRLKLGSNGRRLLSGAIAGAFSRTAVAPLETIRTHLMVGSHGHSVGEVFEWIITNEGWQGLFRGNAINVLRVAPSKAIEVSDLALSRTISFVLPPLQKYHQNFQCMYADFACNTM
jgi:hypothetical protein